MSVAAILPVIEAVGAVVSVVSAISGGSRKAEADTQAAQAQAQADEYNAKTAEYNAAVARQEAQAQELQARRENRKFIGRQHAAVGKSGATTAGSPLLTFAESAKVSELDALNIRYTGARTSDIQLRQARLDRIKGGNALKAGNIRAGTSLLTGATTAVSRLPNAIKTVNKL